MLAASVSPAAPPTAAPPTADDPLEAITYLVTVVRLTEIRRDGRHSAQQTHLGVREVLEALSDAHVAVLEFDARNSGSGSRANPVTEVLVNTIIGICRRAKRLGIITQADIRVTSANARHYSRPNLAA